MRELGVFLSLSVPFGSPGDLSPTNVSAQLGTKQLTPHDKVPSWSAGLYRGPPRITLILHEQIQAMQYDKQSINDTWTISGTLLCKVYIHYNILYSNTYTCVVCRLK